MSGSTRVDSASAAHAAERFSASGSPSYTPSWNHAASTTAIRSNSTPSADSSWTRASTSVRCRVSWYLRLGWAYAATSWAPSARAPGSGHASSRSTRTFKTPGPAGRYGGANENVF